MTALPRLTLLGLTHSFSSPWEDFVLHHTDYLCSVISCHYSKPFHVLPFCNPDDQHLSSSPAHTNPNQRSLTVVGGLKNQKKKKKNMARALSFQNHYRPSSSQGCLLCNAQPCQLSPFVLLMCIFLKQQDGWNDVFTEVRVGRLGGTWNEIKEPSISLLRGRGLFLLRM